MKYTGVLRDTARAPQPPTNPPTGHQMSRPKMNKNANFGQFWAKNPNFYWRNQKFCYPHNEKPPRHLVRIGFWSTGTKWAKNANIWPKMTKIAYFVQNLAFLGQKS